MVDRSLGSYEVLEPLGAGGMGEVYRARDVRLGRDVALKFLPEDVAKSPERLARLRREARMLAAVNHPNIATLYALEEADGATFLSMELVEGRTLAEMLRAGPLGQRDALAIGGQVARALEAAHERGIVHRDLKPANVVVMASGHVKVLDFGLAKAVASTDTTQHTAAMGSEPMTAAGTILGTAPYMSPEQVRGSELDPRSDIWSFGCLLHEAITRRAPFARETVADTLAAILEQEPELSALSEGVSRCVRRCLEKDPVDRFQRATELVSEIDDLSIESVEPTVAPPRIRARALVSVVVVVALLGVAYAIAVRSASTGAPAATPNAVGDTTTLAATPVALAVLPFTGRQLDAELDYLRFAIPDEIVTELSYAEGLAVRPFTASSVFQDPAIDLSDVAGRLGANHVVAGQLAPEGSELRVSVELVVVEETRVAWRDSWRAPIDDPLGLRAELRRRVIDGLLPSLGRGRDAVAAAVRGPRDAEAYDMYLRSLGFALEPAPNREAVALLESAVALDPDYAPAWLELSRRASFDASLGTGGATAFARAVEASERAVRADPDYLPASVARAQKMAELGRHPEGYRLAVDLVRRRPDSAEARLALAYVLRYGGAIEDSAEECRIARRLDPVAPNLTGCTWTFIFAGDYATAEADLISRIDTQYGASLTADVRMRAGDRSGARELLARPDWVDLAGIEIHRACLQESRPSELPRMVREREAEYAAWGDPEALYWYSALLADCGFPDVGYRFLARAIDAGYCAASAVDADPLWDDLRSDPTFRHLRSRANECRDRFLAERPARR